MQEEIKEEGGEPHQCNDPNHDHSQHSHPQGHPHGHPQMRPQMQTLEPHQYKSWICIYPCYFNSNKSLQDGRRVPKSKAVPNPQLQELTHLLQFVKIKHVIEPHKMHPKDWLHPGRIKVQVFDELGNNTHPKILNKKLLFDCICDLLPKHKVRMEAPPKEIIDEKRNQVLAALKKERLERQKDYNKRGIRTTKKKNKPVTA